MYPGCRKPGNGCYTGWVLTSLDDHKTEKACQTIPALETLHKSYRYSRDKNEHLYNANADGPAAKQNDLVHEMCNGEPTQSRQGGKWCERLRPAIKHYRHKLHRT